MQPEIRARLGKQEVDSRIKVLVLCTGNSARSIMAEAILNSLGSSLFKAYSAGSQPTGQVNPLALEQIRQLPLTEGYLFRSKSWDEFSLPGAEPMDLILTVCDAAASEVCPLWPGRVQVIQWGFPDPAGSDDQQKARADFARCFKKMEQQVSALVKAYSISDSRDVIYAAMRQWSCV